MIMDDDGEDGAVTALFQVGPHVLQLKQRPEEGREYKKELEDAQEHVGHRTCGGA